MRFNVRCSLCTLGVLVGLCANGWAQSESRYISQITPRGVQRGTQTVLTFEGGGLAESQEVIFYRPGVRVIKLVPGELERDGGKELKATVQIANDCPLGEHAVRVRTAPGLTTLHTFYVGPYPHIDEREKQSTFEDPQTIPLNVTVNGSIGDVGQVDYYRIEAQKGQRIAAEVRAVRLAQGLFDAHITILDRSGRALIESDDTGLGFQDPIASIIAPKDGPYSIAVRESGYGNEGDYKGPKGKYLLHIGAFARPLSIVPAGGRPGEKVAFRFLGDAGGTFTQKFKLPAVSATIAGATEIVPQQNGLWAPIPHPIRVGPHTNVIEKEPNDDREQATPTTLEAPLAFNGVISRKGDVDCFRFRAKKGQRFVVQVYGRRIRSRLDSVLTIFNSKGDPLAGSDDPSRNFHTSMYRYNDHHAGWFAEDSYTHFTPGEDGEYVAQVADHLKKGGVDYHYRIELTPFRPEVYLWVRRNPPYWRGTPGQSISVPKGNRYAALLSHREYNCPKQITVKPKDLPPGVRFTAPPTSGRVIPMLFEANADAPLAARLTRFESRGPDPKLKIHTTYEQSVFYGLNPPNYCFYGVDQDKLAVAVAREFPVKLELVELKSPLIQHGSIMLKVIAYKDPTFKRRVQLEMLYHPNGVSSTLSRALPPGRSEINIPLEADGGAQPGTYPIAVVARTATQLHGGGVSTKLANLKIEPAYLDLKLARTTVRQGETTQVVAEIVQKVPFEGRAKVELRGLPDGARAKPVEITKETKLVEIPVTVAKQGEVGIHKTLFCDVTIGKDAAPIVHRLGHGGVLRIFPVAASEEEK